MNDNQIAVAVSDNQYPVFPRWVIGGTSIGEGLVKPLCAVNSRLPEFMFMPAVTLLLNYLGGKVHIETNRIMPSFFLVMIGRSGKVIKNSCVSDAAEYFHSAGILDSAKATPGMTMVVTDPKSDVDLGRTMKSWNNRNAVIYFPKLERFARTSMYNHGTFEASLLAMYESGTFSNTLKSKRDSFSFPYNSYCVSLISCASDGDFHKQWPKIASLNSGLADRTFFLLQPEKLDDMIPYTYVNTVAGAIQTKTLIERALVLGTYRFTPEATQLLEMNFNRLGNRAGIRVEKLALYFAVDLGKSEIDESCVERALAVARYEVQIKKYLKTFNQTPGGVLQGEIVQFLRKNGGTVTERELNREIHPERLGSFLWDRVYGGLIRAGWIAETGTGKKGDPKQIVLMRLPEETPVETPVSPVEPSHPSLIALELTGKLAAARRILRLDAEQLYRYGADLNSKLNGSPLDQEEIQKIADTVAKAA
jgi:hypothetical protein